MYQKVPREQIDQVIEYLAQMYPKTFFRQPHLKRPLKKNIVADLERNHALDDDKRAAAISFYQNDWNYQNALQAGAKRIDLDGKEVGTVTEQEALEARNRVQKQKEERREKLKAEGPIKIVNKLHAEGTFSTDQLSKIPELTTNELPMAKAKTPTPQSNDAELTKLRALWSSIESALSLVDDKTLRAALVAPALKVFVAEANKLITTLEGKHHEPA